jgi:outer membrane lipoprotein-sorting protein
MRPHRTVPRAIAACAVAAICGAAVADAVRAEARQKGDRAAASAAAPSFDELYRRGQKANADITSLTARFTETTTPSLLERPLPAAAGMLYVQRSKPPRIALHYTQPDVRLIVIDGNRMTTSWPSKHVLTTSDITQAQRNVDKYFTASDPGDLRRIFRIDVRDPSTRAGTQEVSLTPRRKQISEALARLDLWVEEASGLLKAMRMTFANGDVKLMEFENVTKNPAIDPAVFSVPK